MTITSTLMSPVGGALVAGLFLYGVHEAMSDQTRAMIASLRSQAKALDRVEEYDLASGKRRTDVPSAYHPQQPTLWEEMGARWNSHLLAATRWLTDTETVPSKPKQAASGAAADQSASGVLDALHSLAPHAEDARPKIGILWRKCGDENTHYLGQGASLR